MKKHFLSIARLKANFKIGGKETTRFLGIRVDGDKASITRKLMKKGFRPKTHSISGALVGCFNDMNVEIHIITNYEKVWRLAITLAETDDINNLRNTFNNLCDQFAENPRYITKNGSDFRIDNDVDIIHEMNDYHRRFEAVFYQKPYNTQYSESIEKTLMRPVWFMIKKIYDHFCICIYYDNEYNRSNGSDL